MCMHQVKRKVMMFSRGMKQDFLSFSYVSYENSIKRF
jgi:hypothetical protein